MTNATATTDALLLLLSNRQLAPFHTAPLFTLHAQPVRYMGGADLKVNENECHEFLELY